MVKKEEKKELAEEGTLDWRDVVRLDEAVRIARSHGMTDAALAIEHELKALLEAIGDG